VVLDVDATLVTAHSEKEGAAAEDDSAAAPGRPPDVLGRVHTAMAALMHNGIRRARRHPTTIPGRGRTAGR
jgi:hypothetical protein